ncbi:DNA replication and repair protein RecO [Lachnospiraceae bacterium KH1T2]|nr:DNA replication and repair protein RecO [Lachnospiraceae bacterium KH1T2]
MSDVVRLTGMVLRASDYGEYDKRLVILTLERGKITVFAHGVRRAHNRFLAACEPFAFGEFTLGEGKNAYNFREAAISNYFEGLREDLRAYYLGSYFLETAEFYTRENNDDDEMLRLLYQSLRALLSPTFENDFVKCIFDIKAIVVNGEFPGLPKGGDILPGTLHAISFIATTPISSLYTFNVRDDVLNELKFFAKEYKARFLAFRSKSLEVMEQMGL